VNLVQAIAKVASEIQFIKRFYPLQMKFLVCILIHDNPLLFLHSQKLTFGKITPTKENPIA
jgi:hypothetical protein